MARRRKVIAHTLALGCGIALASTTASAGDAACFGGAPEVAVRDQAGADGLRVHGGKLLWGAGGRVRSLDLDTGALATVGPADLVRAVDDRYVLSVTGDNRLWRLDRRGGKQRVLVDGRATMEDALVVSSVGIHAGYVYFGRTAPDYRRDEAAGFFRVPIDGRRPAERMAMAPDGRTPFVVTRGAVVWLDAGPDAIVIHQRPLGSRGDARRDERRSIGRLPATWAGDFGGLQLVGDELYFTAGTGIWSVALDRQEPARERVPNAWQPDGRHEPDALVVHGSCAYFAAGGVIWRARMDSGVAPETVVPGDRLGEASLATDGRHLYWVSPDGLILRAGPSAAAHVVRPPVVARPAAVQPNGTLHVYHFMLGDDFGCALVPGDPKAWHKWRCWRAGAPAAPPRAGAPAGALARVDSFEMPGLPQRFAVSAGRACALGSDGLRCAPATQVLESRGQVLRVGDGRTGAGGAGTVTDNSTHLFVGGTFACTLGVGGWRCSGDDSYGQLAAGAMAEPARSAAGAWRATWGALGAWHGCVRAADGRIACWGRNDVGQLGHVSTDACRVGDATVPCTRSPRETAAPKHAPKDGWKYGQLIAGDQFTCAIGGGLWCWGGSREGLFGTADGCAPTLRRAWPTPEGPIVAPRATCARVPVRVSGFTDADAGRPSRTWQEETRFSKMERGPAFREFSVGPRAICGIAYGRIRCRGALPTPVIPAGGPELLSLLEVSSGDRPSACAGNGRAVLCWGAGYSPESDPARPVEIDLGEGTSGGAPVVDLPPPTAGAWDKGCRVHRACPEAPTPLPICDRRAGAPAWADLRPRAAGLLGTRIVVRGALGVGRPPSSSRVYGRNRCVYATERAIVVGATDLDADGLLALDGLSCKGDESRVCCQVPAYGQQVRVEGKLVRSGSNDYVLQSPQICQEPAAP